MMKKFKILLYVILLMVMAAREAYPSQSSTTLPTVGPYPGLTMLFNINAALASLQSNFSGAACSGVMSPQTFQFCFDTTAHALRIYDGTNWQPVGNLAGSQWSAISNGVPFTIPASTGSSNAYVVTYASVPTAYVNGQHYPFIANFQNTSAATLNVNSIGAKALKKQGGTALISADIGNGAVVDTVYDGTNLQILSQLGNSSSGTVTSVTCGTGLSGGSITTSGTCSLAPIGAGFILANNTGSSAAPIGTSLLPSIFHGLLLNTQTFSSSGTYIPTSGTNHALILCWGGGGGGGGNGSGGAGTGASGGTTSVGTVCVANGGFGGNLVSGNGIGQGGQLASLSGAVGNIMTSAGNSGFDGGSSQNTGVRLGMGGAGPFLGGAGNGQNSQANTGAGGMGGAEITSITNPGGGGGSGGMSVAYNTSISGTYAVTIGTAGNGGTAGSSGNAGFNGGSGFVWIFEYQ